MLRSLNVQGIEDTAKKTRRSKSRLSFLLTEVNEVAAKQVQFAIEEKKNKQTFIDKAIMPPKPPFPSIIKTRTKNKDIHPGDVANHDDNGNPVDLPPLPVGKPRRRTPKEMKEARLQQELAKKKAEENIQNAIATVGLVEDSLREEDIARQTRPNRQLENVPAFRPPVTIKNGKDLLKTPEKELQDQNDGASFESTFLPSSCY